MTKPIQQAQNQAANTTLAQDELSDEELESVRGGSAFLSGSLTTQQDAKPWLNTVGANANGFIMQDSIIVRTGR